MLPSWLEPGRTSTSLGVPVRRTARCIANACAGGHRRSASPTTQSTGVRQRCAWCSGVCAAYRSGTSCGAPPNWPSKNHGPMSLVACIAAGSVTGFSITAARNRSEVAASQADMKPPYELPVTPRRSPIAQPRPTTSSTTATRSRAGPSAQSPRPAAVKASPAPVDPRGLAYTTANPAAHSEWTSTLKVSPYAKLGPPCTTSTVGNGSAAPTGCTNHASTGAGASVVTDSRWTTTVGDAPAAKSVTRRSSPPSRPTVASSAVASVDAVTNTRRSPVTPTGVVHRSPPTIGSSAAGAPGRPPSSRNRAIPIRPRSTVRTTSVPSPTSSSTWS